MIERDESTRYVPSRLSLWCPICGARENQACKEVKGLFMLRYAAHNMYALGQVPGPQIQLEALPALRREDRGTSQGGRRKGGCNRDLTTKLIHVLIGIDMKTLSSCYSLSLLSSTG